MLPVIWYIIIIYTNALAHITLNAHHLPVMEEDEDEEAHVATKVLETPLTSIKKF